jgi:predicted TIM-barrel fold metal-dependent hydrolase
MLYGEPAAWHAVMRAYNRWLDDDWGYDRDGRIQTGPLLSFVDPVEGERELARVIALGAKFVVLRPAPVASSGRNRSPADPAHDRIWAMAAEAGVVVAFHAADSGYGKLLQQWGESDRYSGQKGSPLTEFFSAHNERPISDTLAALICHGVFERHPTLRVACVELGAGWAPELVRRMKITFGKMPQAFAFKDPVETFQRHVWVAPFYEDDLRRVREAIPAERLLLGSDWPHPEGLPEPRAGIADYEVLPEAEQRLALRENLKALVGH